MNIGETIVFASEPKGIFCFPGTDAVIDKEGLNELMGIGPARIPGLAVFKGMYEVKPGCYLSCSKNGIIENCYWHLKSKPHEDNYINTIDKTRYLVEAAIKKQPMQR